jgi:hypothetical protein
MIPEAHIRGLLGLQAEAGELTEFMLDGNCMAPLLREGDRLRIRHGAADLRVGDIVVLWSEARLVVNRVIEVNERGDERCLRVSSDSGARGPAFAHAGDIVGKVVAVRRRDRWLDLEAPLWRLAGKCLWLRAQVNVQRRQRKSAFWRAVDIGFRWRGRLPFKRSLLLLPLSVLLRLNGHKEHASANMGRN